MSSFSCIKGAKYKRHPHARYYKRGIPHDENGRPILETKQAVANYEKMFNRRAFIPIDSRGIPELEDGGKRPIYLASWVRHQLPKPSQPSFKEFVCQRITSNTLEKVPSECQFNGDRYYDRCTDAEIYARHQMRFYCEEVNKQHQETMQHVMDNRVQFAIMYGEQFVSHQLEPKQFSKDGYGVLIGTEVLTKVDNFIRCLSSCLACYHAEFVVGRPTLDKDRTVPPRPYVCPCSLKLSPWRQENNLDSDVVPCDAETFDTITELIGHLRKKADPKLSQFACPYRFATYAYVVYMFSSTYPRFFHPLHKNVWLHPDRYFGRKPFQRCTKLEELYKSAMSATVALPPATDSVPATVAPPPTTNSKPNDGEPENQLQDNEKEEGAVVNEHPCCCKVHRTGGNCGCDNVV